jgi:diguanylate cyclase (GGDEF)-like protein
LGSTDRSDPAAGGSSAPADGRREVQRDHAEAAGRQPEHQLGVLVQAWVAAVARTGFVTGGRTRVRAVLEESLRRLAAALVAEPFDAIPGYRVGMDLVASQLSSSRALGNTVTLLHRQLIPGLGIRHPEAPARLAALLGELAAGFTEAMRNVAVAAAEDINRAERTAWRRRQNEWHRRLQHALLSERLTGLPNRARLTAWLDEVLTQPPSCTRLGLCLVNLDRFKAVNDSLGHDKGDQLLCAVAQRLRSLTDQTGRFLAHLGGDEFAVVVEHTNGSDDVAKIADLVLRTLREPFDLDGHHVPVAASVGIVECAATGTQSTELLRTADITLNWAKTHHRGHWAIFDPHAYASQLHRHALTAALPAALHRGEFTLAYQPLIRLADRAIVGVEALARWQHPNWGTINPAQFIPLAESTGLIVPLGLHLLEQACAQAAAWHRRGGPAPMVSVNLTAAQLRSPGLPAAIVAMLNRTGLPADKLQLEITENAIVDTGSTDLDDLARNRVRLAIDDFGTDYSSLSYLADLPVHAIKLAPRFLYGIENTGAHHAKGTILLALITLSHDLGLTVIAEGIETAAQADRLTALGCDLGQGFHLGHPTTPERITRLLAGDPTDEDARDP